jgi:endonuclease/exonuclease/phosphatase family metal-dependent hydrolase
MANGSALIGFFEGTAVLARARIVSAESLVYKAQALIPPEHRVALRVLIAGAGSALEVIGSHLTNTEARDAAGLKRTLQARELAAWVVAGMSPSAGPAASAGLPHPAAIVAGDFNDSPESATIQVMLAAGGRDAWAEAVTSGGALGPGLTALNGTVRDSADVADERIDYLFVFSRDPAKPAVVKDAALFLDTALPDSKGMPLWASDHIGVRVDLSLP